MEAKTAALDTNLGIYSMYQGWRQEFSDDVADSSDERAKIWFSGYHKCQKTQKKSLFTFGRGASMLRRGL